jgi:hypothetical protein
MNQLNRKYDRKEKYMKLKVYESGTRSMEGEPHISARNNGNIYINTWAMKQYFKGIRFVELLYDETEKVIGIRPLKEKTEKYYTLGFSSKKSPSTGVVAARGFLRFLLGKDTKSYKRKAEWNEKEQCLIAKL